MRKTLSVLVGHAVYSLSCTAFAGPAPLVPAELITLVTQLIRAEPEVRPTSERLFVQPVNKTEPCKLPTSRDQMDRPNFRAFWDGACKDGYAHGFGRDIATSDTHHLEEITVHNFSQDGHEPDQQVSVGYDLVNYWVFYGKKDAQRMVGVREQITDDPYAFQVAMVTGSATPDGRLMGQQWSPLSPVPRLVFGTRSVGYLADDFSNYPGAVKTVIRRIDPGSGKENGFRLTGFKNGSWTYQAVSDSVVTGTVQLPREYLQHVSSLLDSAIQQRSAGEAAGREGKALERQYLAKFCSSPYEIPKLDNALAKRICNWRDAFSAKYDNQLKKVQAQLAALEAKVAEQERAAQQSARGSTASGTREPDRQADSSGVNEISNALRAFSQSMQEASRGFANVPLPQNTPSFGVQNNSNTRNYLINGSNGLQRRTCTGSGAMQVCF